MYSFQKKQLMNKALSAKPRQYGVTLIELMVAVLIGLLSMYAVYRVYEGSERTKRTIASVGDAQIAGLYSIFLLEQDIHNAGSGLMNNKTLLAANCPEGAMGGVASPSALSLRPLPVVIAPSAVNASGFPTDHFDEVFTFSGGSPRHIAPVAVAGVAGNTATIVTPFGFRSGDAVIAVTTKNCQAYRINGNSPATDANGTTTAVLQGGGTPNANMSLIDLGAPVRHHFYVDADHTLQMAEWVLQNNGTWKLNRTDPVISHVMYFKAQYGIATNNDQSIDTWTQPSGTWSSDSVLAAVDAQIRQIKAVRVALIVRADEPENSATFHDPSSFTLFQDCSAGMTCPEAIEVNFPAGTGPGGTTYRYRMYETVIPLKNAIWNLNS